MSTLGSRHPFVVFADDYGRHASSAQHLFAHIERSYPLIWVNTVGLRRPMLRLTDLWRARGILSRWMSRENRNGVPAAHPQGPVDVLSPLMSPFSPTGIARSFNRQSIAAAVRDHLARNGLPNPIVVSTLPITADLIGAWAEALHVYYCVDDFTQWAGGYGPALRRLEARLLERVDGVMATSRVLHESRVPRSGRRLYFPHGVHLDRFKAARSELTPPAWLAEIPGPKVGYVGLLDERHDLDMWAQLVERLSEARFVLVGPRHISPARLVDHPRVHLIDAVPHEQIPAILAGFDAAVLPYRLDGAGHAINPLKAKEFLAAGVPLVATSLPELQSWGSVIRLADDADSMADAVRSALAQPRSETLSEIDRFLTGESWPDKSALMMRTLESWIGEKGRRP